MRTPPLFSRMLAVHIRGSEPQRYRWAPRKPWWRRLWNWLRDDSDWDGRQW